MEANKRASTTGRSASAASSVANAPGAPAQKNLGAGRPVLAILAGVLFAAGAGGGYLLAFFQYEDKIAAVTQAAELRVSAKNDRIHELEEQQREIVRHADEQERELEQQASAQERALLARADDRERKLAKPDLPVRVWARRALTNNTIVARVHNFGEKELALSVTAHSHQTDQRGTWNVLLAPSGTQVIGKEQGWVFAAGDEIDLVVNGYRPLTFRVPVQLRQ